MKHQSLKSGFTLVETVVAVAIMATLVLVVATTFVALSKNDRYNRAQSVIQSQAAYLMNEITGNIRNASSVTSPTVGATSTSLTLSIPSVPSENPTVYSLSNSILYGNYAGGGSIPLSNDLVNITSLVFTNITSGTNKGAVRVSLSIAYKNPLNDTNLNATTTIISSVSLR